MITTILSQSDKVQSTPVKLHEYNVTFINWEEKKIEQFATAFPSCPSREDWENLSCGWASIGYELGCDPLLVHSI